MQEEPNNNDQRDHQGAVFADQLGNTGQLIAGNPFHVVLFGFKMDHHADAEEMADRGDDGAGGDREIGDSQKLGHDEGGGAHDGGHELPSRGGRSLDRAGELLLVPHLLHHGDGESAGCDRVRDRGAGDAAQQARSDDGDLGRAPRGPACQGGGQVDEQLSQPGLHGEDSEKNEVEDESGHDPQGDAVNPFGPEIHLVDDAAGGIAPVGEDRESGDIGQLGAQVAVSQGEKPQDGEGKPDAPAGPFQDEEDGEIPQDEVAGVGVAGPEDKLVEVHDDVA